MDYEIQIQQGTSEKYVIPVDSIREGSSGNSVDPVAPETVVVIRSLDVERVGEEDREIKPNNANVLQKRSEVSAVERKVNVTEPEKYNCVIDVKCGGRALNSGENWDSEKVCRICHLNSDRPSETSSDIIQLGCGCKDELGIAHRHCAETWFRLKGNRCCEICGETAKNITGIGDDRFMEEWNERRMAGSSINTSESREGCWRGQPFCNFLMACLVIAFVLPWFFRVNMF